MLAGGQSWIFNRSPIILSTGIVGGPFEREGRIPEEFDYFYDDLWMGEDSYEKAHRKLIEEAVTIALKKGNIQKEVVQFMIGGDLINQITPTNFAARNISIPYLGIFSACSTSMEGLAIAASIINNDGANYIITGAASHNAAAERQYRYPTEYGAQKPPTAQWTVTGAGYAIIGKSNNQSKPRPKITSATIGKVVDMGLTDPFNMGQAMAPAAVDTIIAHFNDLGRDFDYYDLIITGDLGKIGRTTAIELLKEKGIPVAENKFLDCGLIIYREDQPVQAGASGAASSATVIYGHIFNQMKKGVYTKVLSIATGALLSPMTFQQKETIPCIAHAVSIEME
ncbi:stage V sporulation protein AD [Fervidibacillus halotolerans]|uniref:Stage V sporulation protein AD n=1 Tax=Fervidibacillus halotolerans TaxID=2980027 RepID=A0A9E8M1C7_9BACI|nr:stage V sporulation protein AD [Fervidibacillus halotolerans]WAA13085.1 stage V sporulation protein AD [Fervidibacillus halotolerans]